MVRSVIGSWLANQLVETWLGDRSMPLFVHVESAGVAGRRSVEEHPERCGRFRDYASRD